MEGKRGLTEAEAAEKLAVYGRNEVVVHEGKRWYRLLLSQLRSPLVYVLIIASVVSFLLADWVDALVILLAVVLNTIFGFVMEYKAEKNMEALSKLLAPRARVKRGEEWVEVDAAMLVPGDVVKLTIGWKVPADGELIVEDGMYLNEAILTGESIPVAKKAGSEAYMGTVVEKGVGEMLVVTTGIKTRMGLIAKTAKEAKTEKTPLQKRLGGLTKQLAVVIVVITAGIFVTGLVLGRPALTLLNTAVALAVAAIPEGLVVGLTVILAVGMKRILAKKAVVRGLVAAETLGSVNVICLDKTGTITEGKMTAVGAVTDLSESMDGQIEDEGKHDKEKTSWLVQGALLCNDLRDPLEISMRDWARHHPLAPKKSGFVRVDELPFDRKYKYIVTRHEISNTPSPRSNGVSPPNLGGEKGEKLFVEFLSGAPEVVLGLSVLSAAEGKKWTEQFTVLGNKGYRMVAMAMKKLPAKEVNQKIKRETIGGYKWLGLILFEDPVRGGVAESLQKAIKAGIGLKVITGDYKETAWACMRQVGLVEGGVDEELVVTGDELSKLSGKEKVERIKEAVLFARTSPEQKLEIVISLQDSGATVAMMGDGVNDVPALKRADIGITVDNASDLAREVADLVLLDSNFQTILSAVEEGRGIFDNLRKVLLYLLSDSFAGIVVVVVSIFLGWPLPLLAAQILWINLISDGFPYMALTIEPKEGDLLTRKPIGKMDPILDRKRLFLVGLISLSAGLLTLGGFFYRYYILGDGLVVSRTFAFAILGTCSLFYVFSCRSLEKPIWQDNIFKNPALIFAVGGGLLMQILAIYVPFSQKIFETVSLSFSDWLWVLVAGVLLIFLIEIIKALFNMVK